MGEVLFNNQGREKRQAERYPLSTMAILEAYLKDQVEKFEFPTRDISSLGAFFLTSRALPTGVHVKTTMYLRIEALKAMGKECEVKVDVDGTVQRAEEDGIAVRFNRGYKISPVS